MAYATLAELRSFLGIDDTYDDAGLSLALTVGEQRVNDICMRTFGASAVAAAKTFAADHQRLLVLDAGCDIQSTSGLIVRTDDDDTGTFETTWTIGTDFELRGGGTGYNGQSGWPYTSLVAVGTKTWPTMTYRRGVQITALWGWAAVPAPVRQATLLLASEAWKSKDAPFGIAGFGEYGPLRVRDNPAVAQLLQRYRHGYGAAVIA